MTVWIYVDTAKRNPEGVAFEYEVIGAE